MLDLGYTYHECVEKSDEVLWKLDDLLPKGTKLELDRPVADFMTPSPETITKQDSIAYALHAMDLGGYRHIPVVAEDSKLPIGIISIRDILRFLCIRFAKLRS